MKYYLNGIFFLVFQIFRIVPNKLLGVLLMVSVPAGLLTVPYLWILHARDYLMFAK